MLKQFAETKDGSTANFTSWSCALADDAVDDFSLPIMLAERAVNLDPDNVFHLKNLGAVLDGSTKRLPSSMKQMSYRANRTLRPTAQWPIRGSSWR